MIPTWSEVLTKIPRLDSQDWQAMGLVKRWFVATRSAVFVMTLFSAGIGLVAALQFEQFNGLNALLVVLGLVLAHATNNLLNDWTDSKKGIDKDNYFRTQYGPQALESGLLTERALLTYFALTGAAAIACGIALIIRTDMVTLYFMLAGAFFVLFYTWPLKYIGLGEPTVWLVWGPLMVCGAAYVVSGQYSSSILWLSIVYGLGPTTVLFGKHTDKLLEDRRKGVYTLPVILGEQHSRYATILAWAAQYSLITLAVVLGQLHWALLLVWLAFPKFLKNSKMFLVPRPTEKPSSLPEGVWPLYLVAFAFDHNKSFSGLFFIGLIVSVILPKMV
ncbi:prenyltransferase [Reinekea sp.]|jgi:1,4-dihydroxy-2-naphthoate octaprenyltransferase|uniref:prenyltransferase n=1 Tax=Reinekea sp. TaxID=1970455 RepID=UPI00398A2EA5